MLPSPERRKQTARGVGLPVAILPLGLGLDSGRHGDEATAAWTGSLPSRGKTRRGVPASADARSEAGFVLWPCAPRKSGHNGQVRRAPGGTTGKHAGSEEDGLPSPLHQPPPRCLGPDRASQAATPSGKYSLDQIYTWIGGGLGRGWSKGGKVSCDW